jgi:hypothetical protein
MENDEEILQSLIKGGLIGGALGALLSKNQEEGATIGAIAGAAILATFKASERARLINIPMCFEENGNLFQIQQDGRKVLIKAIEKPSEKLPQNFKLK